MSRSSVDSVLERFVQLTSEIKAETEKLNRLALDALQQGKSLGEGEVFEQSLVVDKLIEEYSEELKKLTQQ